MKKNDHRQNRAAIVRTVLFAIIVMLIALCLFVRCGRECPEGTMAGSLVVDTRATEGQEPNTEEDPLKDRNVYFSGIVDTMVGPGDAIRLGNREENLDFMMKYEVYEEGSGELVFETDLIPSGQYVDWMPGEALKAGEYILNFLQTPYYQDQSGNYVSLIQGSNQVTLAVRD